MKRFIVLLLVPVLVTAAEKPSRAALGVKTPGVQIPFASLVAEAEVPLSNGSPGWLFFAQAMFAPAPNSLLKIDGRSNKVGDPVPGMTQPCGGMVSAFGSLWVPQCGGGGSLIRLDPKTYKVTGTVPTSVGHARGIIAASSDSIWLLTDDKTTLARIDPDQNLVLSDTRLPAGCMGVMFAEKSIWVACPAKNKVLRLNPSTNVLEQSIEVSAQPIGIAAGAEGSIWVLCRKDGKIDRIESKTNKVVKSIELGVPDADGAIAYGEGWLWVSQAGFPLARIDAKQDVVVQQFSGAGGGLALTTSPGALWLSTAAGVKRIDPKRVLATLSPE